VDQHREIDPCLKGVKIMAMEGKTYVCRICGQEVMVTKAGMGTLVCCNQPMQIREEKEEK